MAKNTRNPVLFTGYAVTEVTLRDLFAALCAAGEVSTTGETTNPKWAKAVARNAYEAADALLDQRFLEEKKHAQG